MPPPLPRPLTTTNPSALFTPIHIHTPHPTTSFRLYSTQSPPSLIQTRNIPAPHTGHIRILSLNSPRNRNAISKQLLGELSTELNRIREQVEGEERAWKKWVEGGKKGGEVVGKGDGEGVRIGAGTRVLIIASALDEVFCAGADLKERRGMSREETTTFLTSLRRTLSSLSHLPIPTLAALSAPALGGGFELALSTDIRFLTSTAVVGLPETRLGIIPGAGGTWRLRRLVGGERAMEMCLSGRKVGGREAVGVGIGISVGVDEVDDSTPRDEVEGGGDKIKRQRELVLEKAVEWGRTVCEGGPGAVQAALRAVREGTAEAEEREYEGVVGMRDRDEALTAFGERRMARFEGR